MAQQRMNREASDKVYVLHPGSVRSSTDGDRHHVTASQLMQLYGVPPNAKTIVIDPDDPATFAGRRFDDSHVHLYPRSTGDYEKV